MNNEYNLQVAKYIIANIEVIKNVYLARKLK